MENLKEYTKNRIYQGKIKYRSNSFKATYTRKNYTDKFGEKNFRWVNWNGKEAPIELIDLFEDTFRNSKLKSNKLEATIISLKVEK